MAVDPLMTEIRLINVYAVNYTNPHDSAVYNYTAVSMLRFFFHDSKQGSVSPTHKSVWIDVINVTVYFVRLCVCVC